MRPVLATLLLSNRNARDTLEIDEKETSANVPLLCSDEFHHPRQSTNRIYIFAAFWMTITSICCSFTYVLTRSKYGHPLGSLHNGYTTEFSGARQALQLQMVRFTGSPEFAENGDEFIPPSSPSLRYMGAGPKVDAAWNDLTKDDEAQEAWGDRYTEFWDELRGGYLAGLDMFHTLHCLNHIRMAFHPNVYAMDPLHGDMHQEHCIEHLRQMILCNSDLTPIPTKFFSGIGRNYINSDRAHTCRDFSKVRQWATDRFNGSSAVKARNKDGSLRSEFYDANILERLGGYIT